ncbi:MAG: tRNA-dihydrouridine synthase family protein [Clostridia bacterium]|nr:tRNA-dihydrouridine synthase family protein [Clostridia bacterium]
MNIQKFFANKPLILSPMAGVTDFAFRSLAREYGADMTISEMVSAKAISMKSAKTIDLLHTLDNESPKAVQLFGHEPEAIKIACQDKNMDKFDIIDFNCGCPAPKIVNNGDGSAMMRDIEKARECISTLVKYSNKPVSVKFRKGIDGVENYLEFGKMCEECGVAFVTLHPRTREQGYSGVADYEAVKQLKSILNIPVVLSGDIVDKASLDKAKSTGADGFMIGRATMGCPWIFNSLKGLPTPQPMAIAERHLNLLLEHYKDERFVVPYFKKHLAWYTKDMHGASALKKEICLYTSLDQLRSAINTLSNPQATT